MLQQQSNNNNHEDNMSSAASPTSSSPPASTSLTSRGRKATAPNDHDEEDSNSSLIVNNFSEESSVVNLCFSKEIETLRSQLKTQVLTLKFGLCWFSEAATAAATAMALATVLGSKAKVGFSLSCKRDLFAPLLPESEKSGPFQGINWNWFVVCTLFLSRTWGVQLLSR